MKKIWAWCKKIGQTRFVKCVKSYFGWDDGIALGIATIGFMYYCKNGLIPYHPGWYQFYGNIHSELIGIGLTVLILGNADQYIRTKLEKKKLILQMGSTDNGFALEAVRQLEARGWLYDGTLRKSKLYEANLTNAHLDKANLKGSNLMRADLRSSTLWLAELSDCCMDMAHLEGARLRGANMDRARFNQSHLKDAEMSEVKAYGASMWRADMRNAHLDSAKLECASLSNANLEGAYMYHAYLVNADLRNSNLRGAKLSGACLHKATLTGADLRDVVFDETTIWAEAKYDSGADGTKWPDGFDPEDAGVVLVEDTS